jgi:alpha-glucosidase
MPFFRTHSAINTAAREPWVFGEPFTHILRQFMQLRYRLQPFLYTLAWEANQFGWPWVRPLFWNNPGNRELWQVEDEFLLGNTLLVAPVVEEGQEKRPVSLPPGLWYDLWEGETYTGDRTIQVPVSLENIPVFVRGGSLLPMIQGKDIHFHLYSPNEFHNPSTHLFTDAGEGYGAARLDKFEIALREAGLEVYWTSSGKYEWPYKEIVHHFHGIQVMHALIDDHPASPENNSLITNQYSTLRLTAK